MKRMQLTDEEARLIEQRRVMENRENLGYNQALRDLGNFIETTHHGAGVVSAQDLHQFIETSKRTIRL